MKDTPHGTVLSLEQQQQGPARRMAGPSNVEAILLHHQDGTTLPAIKITKRTKRFIPEGEYEGLAVKAYHRRNQYRRWESVIEFVLEAPAPPGSPLVMRVGMGYEAGPELAEDHWFGRILEKFGTNDVSQLVGWRFLVVVKTVKKEHTDKYDRPEAEWYSTIRRATLWDEHVLRLKLGRKPDLTREE